MKKIYTAIAVVMAMFALWACGSVDSLETFTFQYTVNFEDERFNEWVPSISYDVTNLNDYEEYRDNKDKIKKSEILHFNFWIDSLVYDKNGSKVVFDPTKNIDNKAISFEYVKFSITFDNLEYFELATFENVDIREYYRNPFHIDEIPVATREKVMEKLKTNPIFSTRSEYSIIHIENSSVGSENDSIRVPYFKYKTDLVLRFEVEL